MSAHENTSIESTKEKSSEPDANTSEPSLEKPLTNTGFNLPPPQEIPDGGVKAWLQVLCSFILFFNSWGIVNSFGVFQNYYTVSLLSSSGSSAISWIGSLQAFLLLAIGTVTGPLFDAGYFYHLIWVGSFLSVFGMMMTSLSTQYYQILLAQGVCVGLASGALFMPSITVIPTYFLKRRAFAQGIAASGSSLGGIIYPIVFYQLQPRIGFPWATRVLGFIVLGTQAIVLALMRTRARPGPMRKLWDLKAFKTPHFTAFTCGMFTAFLGTYIPFFYITEYTLQVDPSATTLSFYIVSILNAGSIFGRIIPNRFADKIGPLNVMTPCALVAGILAFCWIGIRNTGGLIAFALLYGFFTGCIVSMPPNVMTNITPDLSVLGTRMGTCFTFASVGLLIGTPIGGAILGASDGSYVGIQAFGAATVVGASCFYTATRILFKGAKLKVKA